MANSVRHREMSVLLRAFTCSSFPEQNPLSLVFKVRMPRLEARFLDWLNTVPVL
ncbi:hypothetical protein CKA32_006705 [Geitlerinema sp. FC II]|nr:hypothetical protein CKA32_006705 [Geitlerinema sp. FC II]